MKFFYSLVCILTVFFYLGCKEESTENNDNDPAPEETAPPATPPTPENVPTIDTIPIPTTPPTSETPTVDPSAPASPSTPSGSSPQARENNVEVIELVDTQSQDRFIGLKQNISTGQIVLLVLDNEKSLWLSMWSVVGAMAKAAKTTIVETVSYDKKLIDFVCAQNSNEERLKVFIQNALKLSGGATLAIINPEDGSAQTYMGSAMDEPSEYENNIVIKVLIRDKVIQRVVMTDVVNTDRSLSYLNRAVTPSEDLVEEFEDVDLVDYITTLERIKGQNLEFPACNPQQPAPSTPPANTGGDDETE